MDSPALRYFGLPPAQPLRLALVDPIDRFADMNLLMELSKREIRLRSLVSDPHQTRPAEVLSGMRCGDVVALNGPTHIPASVLRAALYLPNIGRSE